MLDQGEMQAEQELVDELRAMIRELLAGCQHADPPDVWRERREHIAQLRQRVRAMRVRHLGYTQPSASPATERRAPGTRTWS